MADSETVIPDLFLCMKTGCQEAEAAMEYIQYLQARVAELESENKRWKEQHTKDVFYYSGLEKSETDLKDTIESLKARVAVLESAMRKIYYGTNDMAIMSLIATHLERGQNEKAQ